MLGRDPVVVDNDGIHSFLQGKVVMVTGGGGSIGSELCRQIAREDPKLLIIFDIYENNAYDIQQELKRKYPYVRVETLIGSVRNTNRLHYVFQTYHPEIIYHAAAHKHVPLMEEPERGNKEQCAWHIKALKDCSRVPCEEVRAYLYG